MAGIANSSFSRRRERGQKVSESPDVRDEQEIIVSRIDCLAAFIFSFIITFSLSTRSKKKKKKKKKKEKKKKTRRRRTRRCVMKKERK